MFWVYSKLGLLVVSWFDTVSTVLLSSLRFAGSPEVDIQLASDATFSTGPTCGSREHGADARRSR
jgi:hypothetical protein